MSLPSFEDIPSVPSATSTPCASSSGTGQMPEPSFMFETGLCTTVTPRSRTSSMSPGVSQIPCSKQTRGERKPIASMCSGSVRPYKRCPDTACIRVSSTWMWITRSSSSARAAQPASISSVQRCGPDGAGQIEIPSFGRWNRNRARRVMSFHSSQDGGFSRSSRSINCGATSCSSSTTVSWYARSLMPIAISARSPRSRYARTTGSRASSVS